MVHAVAVTVAVIVTAHNRADQLEAALSSATAQTYPHLDIVVVDDASTDRTPEVCRRYAAIDSRVRVLRMERNGGVARARNAGLDAVRSDYVAFLDGDDYADPPWIEEMLTAALATDAPLVATGHVVDMHAGGDAAVKSESRPVDELTLMPGGPVPAVHPQPFVWAMGYCWNKLYLRSFLEQHRLRFDPAWPLFEDMMFNLDLMAVAPRVALIPAAHYHYVQHSADRLTNRPQVPDLRFRAHLAQRLVAQLERWGLEGQMKPVIGSLLGWSMAVECSRTTPPGVRAAPALRDALGDPGVQWMITRAVSEGHVRRVDRPVVAALRAGRVRSARTLALAVLGLARVRAWLGLRLAR
ncbi:hypothetical protein J2S59_001566 [Nocardioides massiliensis]|uniref:Glycosyltransferase 2-like domain-containing protein n=1 Tax=Nocardioides massiliensis TaxID=1325935 RepID=A0ABT9NMW5_9ACTN|nr:glycosyltransferase family 2 protein [Nocardioides massiliensis]MDP9821757.1 hypothetical protein [Nocardioides massiliensis]